MRAACIALREQAPADAAERFHVIGRKIKREMRRRMRREAHGEERKELRMAEALKCLNCGIRRMIPQGPRVGSRPQPAATRPP